MTTPNTFEDIVAQFNANSKIETKKKSNKIGKIILILLIGIIAIYFIFETPQSVDRKTSTLDRVTPLVQESQAVIGTEKARIEESEEIIKQTDAMLICSTSYADQIESCKGNEGK